MKKDHGRNRNEYRNVRVIAKLNPKPGLFDIYLDFSGEHEYVMTHRNNEHLFRLLKHGVHLTELERNAQKLVADVALSGRRHGRGAPYIKRKKNTSRKLDNSVCHLLMIFNEYIYDRSWEEVLAV